MFVIVKFSILVIKFHDDSQWENLSHCFLDIENKEAVKAALGMSAVPFYCIADKVFSLQ